MRAFFFDAVWPRIEIDSDSRQPQVTLPDDEYPGDREEWISGYRSYSDGFPLADDAHMEEKSPMEQNSFFHGFMTAYWAEMMAAEVPEELPEHGNEIPVMDGLNLITGARAH